MMDVRTLSLDTRAVKVPLSLAGALHRVFLWLVSWSPRAMLALFPMATGSLYYITPTDSGVVLLTNPDELHADMQPFMAGCYSAEQVNLVARGLQFDAVPQGNWLRTHRYVQGSLRRGGFYIQ